MFAAGLTSGLAGGIEKTTQMAQLREEKARREATLGMQQESHNKQMEQLTLQNQQMRTQFQQLGQQMLRDGSYENIDKWMADPKDDKLQDEYLQATYVQNLDLNQQMARRLGMNELHDVTFNHDTARLQFKDNKAGQTVERPLDLFLADIGYYTKSDAIQSKKRKEAMDTLTTNLGIKKDMAAIASSEAKTNKTNIEIQEKKNEALGEENAKALDDSIFEVAQKTNATPKELNPVAKKIRRDTKRMDKLADDKLYIDTNKHLSLYDGASDLRREVNSLADGIMNDPIGTIEKFAANTVGYTMSDAKQQQIIKANTMAAKLRLLTMDYLQYKSGAAFGEKELSEYEKVAGIADFTDPEAAKSYMNGFVAYLGKRGRSKIEESTSSDGKVLLKSRLANIDKFKDYNTGDTLPIQGKDYTIIGWTEDGQPKVEPKKLDVIDASKMNTNTIKVDNPNGIDNKTSLAGELHETDREAISKYFSNIESKGDYNAENKDSGAYGKYQITPIMMKDLGLTKEELKDPKAQEDAFDEMIGDYISGLERFKLPVNKENLFVLHNLGRTGGLRLLRGTYKKSDISNMRNNIHGTDKEREALSDEEVVKEYKKLYNLKDA